MTGSGQPSATPLPPAALTSAVRSALAALADLRSLHPAVEDGRVELHLRHAADAVERAARSNGSGAELVTMAAVAVRTACAHLAASQWEDGYLALCSANDHLTGRAD